MQVILNSNVAGSTTRPLTKNESNALVSKISDYINNSGQVEKLIILECEKKIAEIRLQVCEKELDKIRQTKLETQKRIDEARQAKVEAQEGRKILAEQKALILQKTLVQAFYLIFYKREIVDQIPTEDAIEFYKNYLSNHSLTVEVINDEFIFRINSMQPIIQCLEEQKESISSCNFLNFKDRIEDISTLCDYLKQPDCNVKSVGINARISQEAKECLSAAVAARGGQLRVVYK